MKKRASSSVSTTRHTHSHTRDARHPSAIFAPSVLRSLFEFPLSPRRREVHCVPYSNLATPSPLPATTSVPRAFLSSLLASPTSTRDLFTNPSTIPADWLAARRAQRNTGCQQAASRTSGLSTRGNLSRRRTRELRVVDGRHSRPRYRRAYSRVYETRTTAHSIHVPPWGISAITDTYI